MATVLGYHTSRGRRHHRLKVWARVLARDQTKGMVVGTQTR